VCESGLACPSFAYHFFCILCVFRLKGWAWKTALMGGVYGGIQRNTDPFFFLFSNLHFSLLCILCSFSTDKRQVQQALSQVFEQREPAYDTQMKVCEYLATSARKRSEREKISFWLFHPSISFGLDSKKQSCKLRLCFLHLFLSLAERTNERTKENDREQLSEGDPASGFFLSSVQSVEPAVCEHLERRMSPELSAR